MVLASRLPLDKVRRYILPATFLTVTLMCLVLIPGIGHSVSGARRWFRFGFVSFQPGEFVRLILILYLAHLLGTKKDVIHRFKEAVLPAIVVTGIIVLLLVAQPKVGTALIVMCLTGIMLFIAGIPFYQLFLALTAFASLTLYAASNVPYIQHRIDAWLHPASHLQTLGFQTMQSLTAIGSGGIWGVGLGQGRQKMFYLPEAHTDMIFPVIAEELGIIGVCCLVSCFGYIMIRGYQIARRTSSIFAKLIAIGLTASIIAPAYLNIMVATGLFPITGIALPLISYGGTSLVTDMTAMGLLSGVNRWSSMTRKGGQTL
jgi:cell division protein FtsW